MDKANIATYSYLKLNEQVLVLLENLIKKFEQLPN